MSQVSMSVTNCLGPEKDMADHLASVAEKNGENDQSLANPTPLMKEMMKKRRSVAPKTAASKSPAKAKNAAAAPFSPATYATPRVSKPSPATNIPSPEEETPSPRTRYLDNLMI